MKRCCSLIGWSLCSGRLEHAPQRLVTYFDVCVCVTVTVCDCVSIYCVCVCVLWYASEHRDMLLARGPNPSHYNPAIGYDRKSLALAPTHPPQPGTTGPARCVSRDGLLCRRGLIRSDLKPGQPQLLYRKYTLTKHCRAEMYLLPQIQSDFNDSIRYKR